MAKEVITRTREQAYQVWLAALEGKKYKQDVGSLKTYKGFCCLGVLGDCIARDGGPKWDGHAFMGDFSLLTPQVLSFMGMSPCNQTQLAHMNDDGYKFPEIARFIRTKLMPKALKRPLNYRVR